MPGLPLLLLGGLTFLVGAAVIAWGGLTRTWINAAAEGDGLLLAVRSAAPAAGQREVAAVLEDLAADGRLTRPRRLWWLLFGGRGRAVVTLLAGLAAAALMGRAFARPRGRTAGRPADRAPCAGGPRHRRVAARVLALSVRWAATADAPEPVVPGPMLVMQGRTGDPGRGPALVAFPLLVASAIAGAAWDLLALAVPLRGVAGEMWLLSALCLAMAYFHATSGWRPLRVPSWLTVLLASATAGAGVALLLTAPSLLMGVTR